MNERRLIVLCALTLIVLGGVLAWGIANCRC